MLIKVRQLQKDGTYKEVLVENEKLKLPTKVLHTKLPVDLELRSQSIWKRLSIVSIGFKTYKDFNKSLRREMHPDREVNAWEQIVDMFEKIIKIHQLDKKSQKQELFDYLLGLSLSGLSVDEYMALNSDEITNKVNAILDLGNSKN